MKILVDTNILLDVLLEREGLADESQAVLDWCEAHPGDGWIAWHTLANLYYIGVKTAGKKEAELQVEAHASPGRPGTSLDAQQKSKGGEEHATHGKPGFRPATRSSRCVRYFAFRISSGKGIPRRSGEMLPSPGLPGVPS